MFYWNNYHLSHTHTHTHKPGKEKTESKRGWASVKSSDLIHKLRMLSEALTGVVCVCSFFFFSFCSCVEAKEFIVILIIIIIIITLAVLTCAHDERSQQLPLAKVRSVEIFMSYWLARKLVQSLWESLAVHSKVEHVFGLWLSTFTVVCPGCTFECVH